MVFSIIRILKNIKDDLLDIISPKVCLSCGKHIKSETEDLICSECLADLSRVDFYKNDENVITELLDNQDCRIEYGCAFLRFQKGENTQQILHNIKYYNHPELGLKLGRIAGYQLKRYNRFSDVDFIIPVPMHPKKQKKRGFNQAERIAVGLSEILKIPIREGILEKVINTKSQTKTDKKQRLNNSRQAFGFAKNIETQDIENKHFLIVDDVFTTGSTMRVCASLLKKHLPNCKVSIFALAKA